MEAEGDESSEDEEEIRAWLDNRGWGGMISLVCGESHVECGTLNTLQEVFDQERILTLMNTSRVVHKTSFCEILLKHYIF